MDETQKHTTTNMSCKNCGHELEGEFCINCGQSSKVSRIRYKYVLAEIPNSLLQIDHGFFYTVKELFSRPGHSLREFMAGKRKSHYKPLAFLLITSTLYTFVNYFIGITDVPIIDFKAENADIEYIKNILDWLSENQTYGSLISLPLFALASYIAFIKSKYNYFEHFVLNMYIVGQQTLIHTFFILLPIDNNGIGTLAFLTPIAFSFWTYTQFFNHEKFFKKMLRFILMYLIMAVLFTIGLIIIFLPFLWSMDYTNL